MIHLTQQLNNCSNLTAEQSRDVEVCVSNAQVCAGCLNKKKSSKDESQNADLWRELNSKATNLISSDDEPVFHAIHTNQTLLKSRRWKSTIQ